MKARIKFTKTGSMKFIGHLDVMRFFQKAMRRAEIDIAYSQGFNRHQLMSFAQPLGVGLTSDGEYLDVELNTADSKEAMMERINAQMNGEIEIVDFLLLEDDARNAMSIVSAADYEIVLKDGYKTMTDFKQKFDQFLTQDNIMIEKKTKKSTAVIDIKPFLYICSFDKETFMKETGRDYSKSVIQEFKSGQAVYLRIATGSVTNIKPDLVMEAFLNYAGEEMVPFSYQYHRFDLLADVEEGNKEAGYVSLGELKR